MTISRRKFLIASSALTAIVVGGVISYPALRQQRRKLLEARHVKGVSDSSPFDSNTLSTIALFTGALFGHRLVQDNFSELVDRLSFLVNEDNGWRTEFSMLSQYINNLTIQAGAGNFADGNDTQIKDVITQIMKPVSKKESNVMALISEDERNQRRMRRSTIPQLVWIYTHSGVPWKIRGYKSWPSTPKDTFEYTQPGPSYTC